VFECLIISNLICEVPTCDVSTQLIARLFRNAAFKAIWMTLTRTLDLLVTWISLLIVIGAAIEVLVRTAWSVLDLMVIFLSNFVLRIGQSYLRSHDICMACHGPEVVIVSVLGFFVGSLAAYRLMHLLFSLSVFDCLTDEEGDGVHLTLGPECWTRWFNIVTESLLWLVHAIICWFLRA
jgi:hypothetical protein